MKKDPRPTLIEMIKAKNVNLDSKSFVLIYENTDSEEFSVLMCGDPRIIAEYSDMLNERVKSMLNKINLMSATFDKGAMQ